MFAHEPKPWDFSDEVKRLTNIYLHLCGIPMQRDQNTAELLRYERLQEKLDRMPPEVPDFTDHATLRQAGIIKELQPAVAEVMSCFQSGKNGRHEDLLRACAQLERSLYRCWQDEV